MDALSEALRAVRITGAVLINGEFSSPWAFESPPSAAVAPLIAPGTEHMVLFHLVDEGHATAHVNGHADLALEAGDIVIIPRGDAHRVWNGRGAPMLDTTKFLPKILEGSMEVERGGGGGATTKVICGYFGCDRHALNLFLAGLPALFKVNLRRKKIGEGLENSIRHAVELADSKSAGSRALLCKFSEALFMEALCLYMDEMPDDCVGWLGAARDEAVGKALAAIHRDHAKAWTLAELSRQAGVSRTILAEKFSRFLGQSPIAYIARWRIQMAMRKLESSDRNVVQIALEVGYESEAAFIRAFKRETGLSPAKYRRSLRSVPSPSLARSARESALVH